MDTQVESDQRTLYEPYQVLARTATVASRLLDGKLATVDCKDVGLLHQTGRFIWLQAVQVNNCQWIMSCLAPDLNERQNASFVFAFPFNWNLLFQKRPVRPRIFPCNYSQKTFYDNFSQENALLISDARKIAPASNGKYGKYMPTSEISSIVESCTIVGNDGLTYYSASTAASLVTCVINTLSNASGYFRNRYSC